MSVRKDTTSLFGGGDMHLMLDVHNITSQPNLMLKMKDINTVEPATESESFT